MPSIPTARRIEYARGYIDLGLLNAASDELEAIEGKDRFSALVLTARMALYSASGHWDLLIAVSRAVAEAQPSRLDAWINWAYGARRVKGVEEAKQILLQGKQHEGQGWALLHFNLACYHSVLGELDQAKERLAAAYKIDPACKKLALEEPDLEPLWNHFGML